MLSSRLQLNSIKEFKDIFIEAYEIGDKVLERDVDYGINNEFNVSAGGWHSVKPRILIFNLHLSAPAAPKTQKINYIYITAIIKENNIFF